MTKSDERIAAAAAGNGRFVDEFELIGRCFRDRATPRPGTVLGIGDDAALLDTGGLPLAHARATVPFSKHDDAAGTARRAFGAAFVRLAAQAVTPRWATLGLTFDPGGSDWTESFAAATAALCDAGAVELIGGDTTRGPGRATVFALGVDRVPPLPAAPRPPAERVGIRLALARAPEHAIADLVRVCADLAARGAEIRFDETPGTSDDARADVIELIARTDAAGRDALHALARRLHADTRRLESDD